MFRLLTALPLAALPALLMFSLGAQAQPAAAGWQQQTVRCESNDNRTRQCQTGWRDAQLVRQLSRTRCVEGQNWGSRNGQIWVSNGCRAEFAAAGRGQGNAGPGNWQHGQNQNGVVRCESHDNRRNTCRTGWRNATLTRQLSRTRCVEGQNWGSRNGQIWVDGGCRAEFVAGRGGNRPGNHSGNGYNVTCSSDDNRTRTCDWQRRAGRPVLVEQLSRTRCVEGQNWGYNGNAIWVSKGCRARFAGR